MTQRRLVLCLALCGALACGKQTFLAAAFVQTPALPNPQDNAHPIQGYAVMTAYFGTIDTTDPTKIDASKIGTVKDAVASVSWHHVKNPADSSDAGDEDRTLDMGNLNATPAKDGWTTPADGTYLLNSKDQPRLTFEPGQRYTLVLMTGDAEGTDHDAYGASFTPGAVDDMQEFAAPKCSYQPNPIIEPIVTSRCIEAQLGHAAMTVTRTIPPPAGGDRQPAFILVGSIDPNNPTATPNLTFKGTGDSALPESGQALLKYVLSDRPFRWATYQIPESAFPTAGYYIVTLLTVKQGKVSGNAFLGSTALAASGSAGIVHVQ